MFDVRGKVAIVTGGARGIGRALCERLHAGGAAKVVVVDLDGQAAGMVAERVGGVAVGCDVSSGGDVERMVGRVQDDLGQVDLYCSNAGVLEHDPDPWSAASASDEAWARSWGVNVMGHVHAARALLPSMIARREGHFLITVSAAGLLSQIGSGPYSTTKHAALGFAEHLAITHRADGIGVSALCPQGVDTDMARGATGREPALKDGLLSPAEVAESAIQGLLEGRFMILPHPRVSEYFRNKAADYDRWVGGMAKLRRTQLA